jgi:hypothetical protein
MTVAGHGAATAIVRTYDEAVIAAAEQFELVANLVVRVGAEADEESFRDVSPGFAFGAGGIGSAAICF